MSQINQTVAIIGAILGACAVAWVLQMGVHVFRSLDHDESHDWRDG